MELTQHCLERSGQRGIPMAAISKAIKFGCKIHRTGIVYYILRKKDILKREEDRPHIEKLEGLTVLVSPFNGKIITVYKNRNSYRIIKKKSKNRAPYGSGIFKHSKEHTHYRTYSYPNSSNLNLWK